MVTTLRAVSFSVRLAWTLAAPPVSARVLSVHTRAVNILTSEDCLLSLVHPDLGNGPFHVVVSAPLPFSEWAQTGETVTVRAGSISLGDIAVDLRPARVWDPTISWRDKPISDRARDVIVRLLTEILPRTGDNHDITLAKADDILARILPQLVRATRAGDGRTTRAALARIIGLGPGLTPAGDDVVLGVLAGLWARQGPGLSPGEVAVMVDEIARGGTHRLSREWLRAAGQGAFAEAWHRLAAAMNRHRESDIREAMTRILHTGASSGLYALWGFKAVGEFH